MTIAQTSIGLLRQHIGHNDRVHGIITHGGEAPNIVPAHTSARYMVRAKNLGELERIRTRVTNCFEAGALATGAKLKIRGGGKPYAEMVHDHGLATIYQRNAEQPGRTFPNLPGMDRAAGSTDMGNVSRALPSIHPMIGINSLPAINHQPEFTAHCISADADRAVFDGALAMAWTIADAATDKATRERLLARNNRPSGR